LALTRNLEIADGLRAEVQAFTGDQEQKADVTLVIVKRLT